MSDSDFRELSLRMACPILTNNGCLRIALTGFEQKYHADIVHDIQERLDCLFTLTKKDDIIKALHIK